MAFTGTDQIEKVLNTIIETGRVVRVQLKVGSTKLSRNFNLEKIFFLNFIRIGSKYTKPNTADIDRRKPTLDNAVGEIRMNRKDVKGSNIWIELLRPKRRASIDILLIIQALTIEEESPDKTAKDHIVKKLTNNLNLFGRNENALLTIRISTVTLYPEAATIWLTPLTLVASSKVSLNNLF